MSCQPKRCGNCSTSMQACQLRNGLCPSCYSASLNPKPNVNPKTK